MLESTCSAVSLSDPLGACTYIHAHAYCVSVDSIHCQTCYIDLFVSVARDGTGLNDVLLLVVGSGLSHGVIAPTPLPFSCCRWVPRSASNGGSVLASTASQQQQNR